MKYTCRILPILITSLTLAPLPALADQLAYPEHFRALGIPQLPGSKVIEVKLEGKVPVEVTLESEDTHRGVDVIFFYGNSKPFEDEWDYDGDTSQSLESEPDTVNMIYVNKLDGQYLLIKILTKGRMGSRVELIYPWADPTEGWFLDLLKHGDNAE